MDATALVNLAPIAQLLAAGALLAVLALVPLLRRHRGQPAAVKLRALTVVTLFLTFDLVLFGAFTRLTDSGLGCPDWPGCYGNATPAGAHAEISQAQAAMPTGPVTHGKAWVEMVHRYLATGVGALITFTLVASLWLARRGGASSHGGLSPGWAALVFAWVCAQGAFGALTVTMKLYPAIVTVHLLGGIGLLVLLTAQWRRFDQPMLAGMPTRLRTAAFAVFALLAVQIALGGWVSTNYAVLACDAFPGCRADAAWPGATGDDYATAFTLRRELGHTGDGALLPFAALQAIHWVHRLGALVVFVAAGVLAWRLHALDHPAARRHAAGLAAALVWQLATGLSNVVLGWPLVAAVAHTAGAAALAVLLTSLLASSRPTTQSSTAPHALPTAAARPLRP